MFFVAFKIILYDKTRSFITLIFAQISIYSGLMETASIITVFIVANVLDGYTVVKIVEQDIFS